MRIKDYQTGEMLPGEAHVDLAAASMAAGETGAVVARYSATANRPREEHGGTWFHVRAEEEEQYRRQGWDVRTVYVEGAPPAPEAHPTPWRLGTNGTLCDADDYTIRDRFECAIRLDEDLAARIVAAVNEYEDNNLEALNIESAAHAKTTALLSRAVEALDRAVEDIDSGFDDPDERFPWLDAARAVLADAKGRT